MLKFICKLLNVQVMSGFLLKRTMMIVGFSLAYSFANTIEQKVYGSNLSVFVLGVIGILLSVPQMLSGWFKNISIRTSRTVFAICDCLEILGYVSYAYLGDAGAYVFAICLVGSYMVSNVVGSVYAAELSDYIRIVAGERFKEFQIANQVLGNGAAILGGIVISLLSLFIELQALAGVVAVLNCILSYYNYSLISDLITETESEEYKLKSKAINELASE